MKTPAALLLPFALTGCVSLAPPHRTPPAPVQPAWPMLPAPAAGPPLAAAGTPWQAFYTDPKLQQVLTLALQHNRDLRIAVLNTERARAVHRIQRAQLVPGLSALGAVSRQGGSAADAKTVTLYTVGLGVSAWEVDLFGRLRSLKERALEQFLASEQAARGTRIALLGEVANVYLALVADRESLAFAEDTLASQEVSARLVRRRFEVGASPEVDVHRAQVSLETAREDVARLTSAVAMDRNALELLVGTAVPAELVADRLEQVAPLRECAPGLPAAVLTGRPDIQAAEHQLRAANANIGAARAAFLPNISLTAGVGTASSELSGLFKSGSGTWAFAPQIVLPIFDLGARRAGLAVARVDRDLAVAAYEKAIEAAFREVADTLAQRATLEAQLSAHASLVGALEATLKLATARHQAGIDGSLGVLDAQRSLVAARQGLIALRRARSANLITLYKVLGGGDAPLQAAPLQAAPVQAAPGQARTGASGP